MDSNVTPKLELVAIHLGVNGAAHKDSDFKKTVSSYNHMKSAVIETAGNNFIAIHTNADGHYYIYLKTEQKSGVVDEYLAKSVNLLTIFSFIASQRGVALENVFTDRYIQILANELKNGLSESPIQY